jgi:hypothetical protein
MSRRVLRSRSGVVTGDLLQDPVGDIAALRLLAARDINDGQLILVRGVNRLYAFVYGDSTVDDGANVIAPTYDTAVGRWKRLEFSGGGSGDFADKWVDVTTITSSETVTVDGSAAADVPQEIRREELNVEGVLNVVDGYVILGPPNLGEVLETYNQSQGSDIELSPGDNLVMSQNPPPTTPIAKGIFFVGDGTGGTAVGEPYFRAPSDGTISHLNALGGEATVVVGVATSGEALAVGELVRFDTSGSPGEVLKAQATVLPNTDAMGVVKASVGSGSAVSYYERGSVPVLFGAAPSAANNGSRVYLDSTVGGQATLTAPSTGGTAVLLVGWLRGANGVTTTPTVQLKLDLLYVNPA